ncbi:exopolyphosphatase [Murimonas intestini]|uniref:Exopolyphosphatase/guanosine-5'-triphosphate, 3'-diphosphate pyrophosphatase n=1 Tax=Murimonas intestini TaxID=1337051 RepID=A0AB73T958_9FIRM|nr:exopolyphosphatase [Murimonas intestini]MCR1839398.1 exopolyphosphatase [Murimonas intestini]MCR1864693.1 exopolyphosphatase [Murimonas intestini]MCR1882303.1 exopolyphosphatase [Murimonas intestini]
MRITTFAAIDVGSYEVEMKIFELSSQKGMKEIDSIRRRIELGKDVYATGKVSVAKVEELCALLQDFVVIMEGYKVDAYRACATSAIREAESQLILVDYIEKQTGLKLEVLSNSEQRFLDYKCIASRENEFNKIIQKGTAIVDVGGGSVQISLFDKDSLVTTQNMRMGNLRIREKLADLQCSESHSEKLIEELINNELSSFEKLYLRDREIQNIIIVGDYISEIMEKPSVTRAEFMEIFNSISGCSPEEIAEKNEIPVESASLIMPSMVIYKRMVEEIGAETIWMPGLNLTDGLAFDYAQKKKILKFGHNFDNDIIASARNMAKRYMCSKAHIKTLEELALAIFDKTKKIHGLSARERLLLQIAVILHGCGKYVSLSNVAECSYSIIMATEIIGLSHSEREIIANVVKFNTMDFDYYDKLSSYTSINQREYLLIAKLTAILRIANALDRSHKQKFKNVKISLKEKELIILVETDEDITLEKGLLPEKAAFFEEVFSLEPVIRQKKKI